MASSRRHPGSLAAAGATCTKPTRATPSKLDFLVGWTSARHALCPVQHSCALKCSPIERFFSQGKDILKSKGPPCQMKILTFLCSWGGIGIFGRKSRQLLTFLSGD
jgi:hypothetical protein